MLERVWYSNKTLLFFNLFHFNIEGKNKWNNSIILYNLNRIFDVFKTVNIKTYTLCNL
jgi:hypothetical protein